MSAIKLQSSLRLFDLRFVRVSGLCATGGVNSVLWCPLYLTSCIYSLSLTHVYPGGQNFYGTELERGNLGMSDYM